MLRPKNKGVGPKPCFMAGCLSRGGSLKKLYLIQYELVAEGDDSYPHDFNSPAEQSKGGDPIKDETNQSSVESLTQLM